MLKDMKLGAKLALGFGTLIAIAMVLGAIAVINMNSVQNYAGELSRAYVPEVAVSNEVERHSLQTMYQMRGYAYTEEVEFLNEGKKYLEQVKKDLQIADALAKKESLPVLSEGVRKAREKVSEYEKLAQDTIVLNRELAEDRKNMDTAAAAFLEGCNDYLLEQTGLQKDEFLRGAGAAELDERAMKIRIINEVLDNANYIRIGNFKAQATRDPALFRETMKRFDYFQKNIGKIRSLTRSDRNLQNLATIEQSVNEYKQAMEHFLKTWLSREDLNGKRVAVADAVLEQAKTVALTGMENVNRISDQTVATLRTSSSIMIFGLIAALLVGIVFAVTLTKAITGPVVRGVEFVKRVAQGDVSANLDITQKDEIGILAAAMNTMVENLRKMVSVAERIAEGDLTVTVNALSEQDALGHALRGMVTKLSETIAEINLSANNVASGSEQMNSTSQAMSQGATEQASSLEEISSSMNEIASQTRQNAENATQANQLSGDAKSLAEKGNQQMQRMVVAMKEINESSQSISKIIKVIDEIAFQTNLLALNAAVEAARAGRHGKGFAVVAEEVRNLAARSAKAAKETADLIETSVKKVDGGTEIADKTAESLNEIVTAAAKVTDLVGEIAAASSEQAQGVTQITSGLGQIDQVTQQNTAHAEESASAAEELSSQAMVLQQLVNSFRVEGAGVYSGARPQGLHGGRQKMLHASGSGKENGKGNGNGKENGHATGHAASWGGVTAGNKAPEPVIALDDREFGKY